MIRRSYYVQLNSFHDSMKRSLDDSADLLAEHPALLEEMKRYYPKMVPEAGEVEQQHELQSSAEEETNTGTASAMPAPVQKLIGKSNSRGTAAAGKGEVYVPPGRRNTGRG